MDPTGRRVRGLLYVLMDVEAALRKAGRADSAAEIGKLTKAFTETPPPQFVESARESLQEILLGERDIPADAIGVILDAIGAADELLRGL